jgi:hypothetical protein
MSLVLVPITPTAEMLVAGQRAAEKIIGEGALKQVEACYEAMLKAAPPQYRAKI